MLKRVAVLLFCLLMVFVATFGFVVGVVSVPTIYSYAQVVDDDHLWEPLRSESDLVKSFQSYCKSRDLTIEGSIADAVTTFTTGTFNIACNTLGIDITKLQAEIKAEYDNSGLPLKFAYNASGIATMNRIFAQFLQDNELEVGDTADQQSNTLYDGRWFVDFDGNGCLVYKVNDNKAIIEQGSTYKFNVNDMQPNGGSHTFNLTSVQTYNLTIYRTNYSGNDKYRLSTASGGGGFVFFQRNSAGVVNYNYGRVVVASYPNGDLYLGCVTYYSGSYNSPVVEDLSKASYDNFIKIKNGDSSNCVIFLTTFNNVINNNVYEGDTYITNEGDVINPGGGDTPGGNNPGWDIGGGGGTATDGNGNTWNITFPDFQLPDLNIDWSINGLGDKFPFSIPFDLVALVTVLNAEPQAPRFEGTVNFGFTTWDYDINLEQFDSVAQACRIAELLLLVVGLILITRSIIKG